MASRRPAIRFVGVGGILDPADDAEIPEGATLTAFVDSGNPPLTANAIP